MFDLWKEVLKEDFQKSVFRKAFSEERFQKSVFRKVFSEKCFRKGYRVRPHGPQSRRKPLYAG